LGMSYRRVEFRYFCLARYPCSLHSQGLNSASKLFRYHCFVLQSNGIDLPKTYRGQIAAIIRCSNLF
jgi:hypothetical protein